MTDSMERRDFLRTAAGGALLGLFPSVPLLEARLDPAAVRMGSGIDPLVKLIEETPRARLLEEMGDRVRKGLAYKEALAALLLAGVRNVRPTPVGFKFHGVLVVNSAHLASLSGPDADRWLPIFWALDNFKGSQADEKNKTGWTQPPVDESALPAPDKAKPALADALDRWDVEGVDAPAAAMAKQADPKDVFELFCRYGARDFRDIGHKIIFVASAFRTLEHIGWQHAEPVLRSLAMALQYHTGENPSKADHAADRPWKRNVELAPKIRAEWREGKADAGAADDLFKALRQGSDAEMAAKAVELLNAGVAPQSLWDALLTAGGEILMRRPGIQSLHALTTMNAMRYCFDATAVDDTRRMLLLQAASFIPLFRGKIDRELALDKLESATAASPEEILADVSKDNLSASRKVLGYLANKGSAKAFVDAARVLTFLKGRDSHDYKFSSAVLEDYEKLSPGWRDRFLAASVHHLRGSQTPDNGLVQRIRASLKT